MGMSLSTYLFWGVDLADMSTGSPDWEDWTPAWMRPDGEDGDLEWDPGDHLAGMLGWSDMPWPANAVVKRAPDRYGWSSDDVDRTHPDWVAYEANRTRRAELLDAADYGCEIDSYGATEGDTRLYVAVSASVVKSDAWTCEPIEDRMIPTAPVIWGTRLTSYLQLLDIPLDKAGPMGWYMTGYYG